MALSFLFESGILMLFIGPANALVNIVMSSGLTIEGTFYRLNNERIVTNARINCALKCQTQWNCFFFAIGSENSCLLFTDETNGGFEIYYRHPIVTVEMKTRSFLSESPGYLRINNKQYGIHFRGFSTMEISSGYSELINFKAYDTHYYFVDSTRMLNDLKGFADGTIVAGSGADDVMASLYKDLESLNEIGLDFRKVTFRNTVCFLWIKGQPTKTFMRIEPSSYGDLRCKVRIYHDPAAGYTLANSLETVYD